MIRYCLVLIFILIARLSFAQITYEYDAAGNRVLRKPSGPLPVTLISFTAEKADNNEEISALLRWQTSAETNSDRFVIERSQDGKIWSEIGRVKAAGDKLFKSDYTFKDEEPHDRENLYRLRMIDLDGTFSFSRIQSLYFDSRIIVYPNPVQDVLKIKGLYAERIELFNQSGKLVLSSEVIPENGINMRVLPTGIYIIKIFLKNGVSTIRKVVKE